MHRLSWLPGLVLLHVAVATPTLAGTAQAPVDITASTPWASQTCGIDTADTLAVAVPFTSMTTGFRLVALASAPSATVTENKGTWYAYNIVDNGATATSSQYFVGSSGTASMQGGVAFGCYLFCNDIPVFGDWEKDLLPYIGLSSIDLTATDQQLFTPFLLSGSADRPVVLYDDIATSTYGPYGPGIPGIATFGVTVKIGVEMSTAITGTRISVGSTGFVTESATGTTQTKSMTGRTFSASWSGGAQFGFDIYAEGGIGVNVLGVVDVNVPIVKVPIPIPIPSSVENQSLNPQSSASLTLGTNNNPSGITVSASLSPSTVTAGASVLVSGTATYDNGLRVGSGTATISISGQSWTAALNSYGQFSRTIQAPGSSGSVSIVVSDGSLQGSTSEWLTVSSGGSGTGYTLQRTTTCRDVQSSSPYDPTYETEYFRRSDSRMYVWVHFTNLYQPIRARWQWYDPDGNIHWTSTSTWTDDPGGGYYDWWKLWAYINIDGYLAADRPGRWSCKISVDHGSGWVYRATEEFTIGYEFTEHRMAKDVQSSSPYMPIDETNVFFQTDTRAITWANGDRVVESLDVRWRFYEPNGSLYDSFTDTTSDPGADSYYTWYRFWGWVSINGSAAASKCGDWHVDVAIKDAGGIYRDIYTDYFTILENPNVAPTVSVTATPGTPYASDTITIGWSATDNTYLERVEFVWNDGTEHQTVTDSIFASTASDQTTIGPYAEGTAITVYAVAYDTSGNSTTSNSLLITVADDDTSGPTVGTVTIEEYMGNGNGFIDEGEQIRASWTVSDPSGVSAVSLTVDGAQVTVSGSYYAIFGPLSPGDGAPAEHSYVISATDADNSPETTHVSGAFLVYPASGPGPEVVVINEIDPGDTEDWVEICNPGSDVDLTGWTLEMYSSTTYAFPSGFVLYGDSYVVIHEYSGTDTATDLYTGVNIGFVAGNGYCALKDASGTGVDFVRWGSSAQAPPAGTSWTGTVASGPVEGDTLGRDEWSTDTDNASDWENTCGVDADVPTPRSPNLAAGVDDVYEDNDTFGAAATLTAGDYSFLQCLDDDYYKVYCSAGQTLTATITFTHASGDLDMALLDSGGGLVDGSAGVLDSETVSYQPSGAEYLYIYAYGYAGATNSYSLTISLSGGPGPDPDPDPGDETVSPLGGGCAADAGRDDRSVAWALPALLILCLALRWKRNTCTSR